AERQFPAWITSMMDRAAGSESRFQFLTSRRALSGIRSTGSLRCWAQARSAAPVCVRRQAGGMVDRSSSTASVTSAHLLADHRRQLGPGVAAELFDGQLGNGSVVSTI